MLSGNVYTKPTHSLVFNLVSNDNNDDDDDDDVMHLFLVQCFFSQMHHHSLKMAVKDK